MALLQVLVMLCFPLFSYAGVVGTASGMVDLKDMKPLLNMLRPSSRALMVRVRGSSKTFKRAWRSPVQGFPRRNTFSSRFKLSSRHSPVGSIALHKDRFLGDKAQYLKSRRYRFFCSPAGR